ncbi:MAG TPA: hypoxanthine phosphoribosyltransferase [Terrimicrobiaceae bacterium]|nr:hypoxanthine phosphoribosyltransferase [Terrimicrobiaceae bacterium]
MLRDIRKILYHESTIFSRLDELASEIAEDYRGKELTVIAVLNGSFIFMADLLRRLPLQLQVDCLSVSSYHGTKSTGKISFRQAQLADTRGRHVLILDDILDSGMTLHTIRERLAAESGALSLKICVLLRKNINRERQVDAEYVGFDIPNEFVVGYGLDYNERYRNLPFVGVLTDEAIRRHALPPRAETPQPVSRSARRGQSKPRQARR